MKRYFAIALLGVGCIYAATSLFSHRFYDNTHQGRVKKDPLINLENALDKENVVDIAIIGSGPAGLMASVYGCRAGRQVICFEGAEPGGLLTKTTLVENWPGEKSILGPDIIKNMHLQAEELGAHFIHDTVIKTDFSQYPYRLETEDGLVVHALSVIVTTGAKPKTLGIPGENTFWGKGVTTCAVCDAPFYKNKDVVVIGGGDSAVEEAIQLTPYARSITLMVRGSAMRAAVTMQQRLAQYSNIFVRYNVSLQEIVGDTAGVTGILVRDNQTGNVTQERIDGVFLAIGHEPNVWMLDNQLTLCDTGHIALCGRTQQTSVPGVFAAGDVSDNEYRQAGVAAGDGIKAALDADRFLMHHGYSQVYAQQIDEVRFYPPIKAGEELVQSLETIEAFNALVSPESGLVLLDFYATYCSICMQTLPLFEWVANRYRDVLTVYSVDFERAEPLATHLGVQKVPTLLIFKDGQLIEKIVSPMSRAELTALVERYR